jgi:hypothetical protein
VYLARKNIKGVTHYSIRESYRDGDHFLSRELVDLGTHPAEHIIYPGGDAFYIGFSVPWSIFGIEKKASEKAIKPKRNHKRRNSECIFSTNAGCIILDLVAWNRVIYGLYRKRFSTYYGTNPGTRLSSNFWIWNSS